MATYAYRCAEHGVLEVSRPIGTAPSAHPCPGCGAEARRVFTAPRLSLGSASARRLIDATERTRDEPAVVTRPSAHPSPSARPPAGNPALSRLPRY